MNSFFTMPVKLKRKCEELSKSKYGEFEEEFQCFQSTLAGFDC